MSLFCFLNMFINWFYYYYYYYYFKIKISISVKYPAKWSLQGYKSKIL